MSTPNETHIEELKKHIEELYRRIETISSYNTYQHVVHMDDVNHPRLVAHRHTEYSQSARWVTCGSFTPEASVVVYANIDFSGGTVKQIPATITNRGYCIEIVPDYPCSGYAIITQPVFGYMDSSIVPPAFPAATVAIGPTEMVDTVACGSVPKTTESQLVAGPTIEIQNDIMNFTE